MKLLFEEYSYHVEDLRKIVSSHFYTPDKEGKHAKLNYVGYFFNYDSSNPGNSDAVFILPKVFLNEKSEPFELEGCDPESIMDLDDETNRLLHDEGVSSMVSELAVWFYQAIHFYHSRVLSASSNKESANIRDVISNQGDESVTYLDTVLQLRKFYKEHKQLLTFISIINNSSNNKIQWAKTISHETPIIRNNRPAYVSFRTKEKTINFDEELIVVFYSVLDYLKHSFHFAVNVNVRYTLIPYRRIKAMIDSSGGTRYLKKIRKKYFADEFVALWKLLYAYFDKAERIASRRYHEETLLVRDFNPVFEDMIDYLISDDDYPEELKVQNNGSKIVDHLYEEKSLLYDEHIYFVGDSKYYNAQREMDEPSITKQYSYAKNIIQRNIDVICGFDRDYGKKKVKEPSRYFHYRDELTKGYNITPNFFISGIVRRDKQTKKYDSSHDMLENITGQNIIYNRHFVNRLFDRDTLVLQRYNINFLYVLTSYAAQQQAARDNFRTVARQDFRKHIIKAISDNYKVYQICLAEDDDIESFIKRNYYELAGQIFSFDNILLYGEEISEKSVLQSDEMKSKVTFVDGCSYLILENEEVQLQKIVIGERVVKEYAGKLVNGNGTLTLETDSVRGSSVFKLDTTSVPFISNCIQEEEKFTTHLPLYSIRAACGKFLEADRNAQISGWLDTSLAGIRPYGEGYFVVQASGESMSPKIHNGDYCVFRTGGSTHNGDIVIACIYDQDEDYNGRFTIKEFFQEFIVNEDGVKERQSVTLKPINRSGDFPIFELNESNGDGFGVFGVLVDVISSETKK